MSKKEYLIPQRPKIKQKNKAPDQRKFSVIPLHVIKKRMTLASYRVLVTMSSYCNKGGFTHVSLERIGSDLGVTKQSVSRQVQRLIKLGIVKKISGHYPMIKGATRRIIYDEKINDDEASKISNSPIELTNKEINELLMEKRVNKSNNISKENKRLKAEETRLNKDKLLSSLLLSVSDERELVMLERLIESGVSIKSLQAHVDGGYSVSSFDTSKS